MSAQQSASAASLTPMKLKIRGPNGDKLITSGVNKNSTLQQLKEIIARECGVPVDRQELLSTYPPPSRVLVGGSSTLGDLKIQSSDVLMLKQIEPNHDVTPTPATTTTAPTTSDAPRRPSSPRGAPPASLESLSHLTPLTVMPIPNDNSCLFNSIGLLMEGAHSHDLMTQLREIVASVIMADSDNKYTEAFLGSPKQVYVDSMLKSNTWGGGIELDILAEYYDVEICAIDVETCHQYCFRGSTTGGSKSRRIYTLYSGVHYDAMVDTVNCGRRCIFPSSDTLIEQRALLAARLLQRQGAFTNVSKFTLRCSQCATGLVGAVEAQQHAKQTGHQQFEEYAK